MLVAQLAGKLDAVSDSVAIVALGAYGRRELTPRADIELLFVSHAADETALSTRWVTEAMCYPLWEQHLRVEPLVRTLAACASDARRSWSAAAGFLDARYVAGAPTTFEVFSREITQPWRRDRERLAHSLRPDVQRRHAIHPSATASTLPDLHAGRGGLQDLQALRWLEPSQGEQLAPALDFLLRTVSAVEELIGQLPQRLPARVQERLARGGAPAFLNQLYAHTRRVAFSLDSALTSKRDDRQLGMNLAVRRGELAADRLPPPERAPVLALRIANLVGLAPPDAALLTWASAPGPPIGWDEPSLDQFWLLLRAADWRAWEFLDTTGLLVRYLPELQGIWRQPGPSGAGDLALDSHSFLALRRLHEWTESGDLLAQRAWRGLRRRDWLYLSVLLHELNPESAQAAAQGLGLPAEACATLSFVVSHFRLLADTATRRDLHDEDMVLELATRVRTRQRLSMLFLVAAAHDLAVDPSAWTPWRADLMRQLFGVLDVALRQAGEVGRRRTRSLEQHRARIARVLEQRGLERLLPLIPRLPRRYVLTRTPAFIARHMRLLAGEAIVDGEVRMQAHRHRQPGLWDVQIVARDRPGLLATVAGVLALRGASVLAADAATCADGLVLDVFTVGAAHGAALDGESWLQIAADVQSALNGRIPLRDLLGARPLQADEADCIHVGVDSAASQFFSIVEVRAPDQVGLLYRIADGLHELGLDIHQARIATHPEGALDVFYVRDLAGNKLDEPQAEATARALAARLKGQPATAETPSG